MYFPFLGSYLARVCLAFASRDASRCDNLARRRFGRGRRRLVKYPNRSPETKKRKVRVTVSSMRDAPTKEGLRDRWIDEANEEEAAARVALTETATKTVASPAAAAGF